MRWPLGASLRAAGAVGTGPTSLGLLLSGLPGDRTPSPEDRSSGIMWPQHKALPHQAALWGRRSCWGAKGPHTQGPQHCTQQSSRSGEPRLSQLRAAPAATLHMGTAGTGLPASGGQKGWLKAAQPHRPGPARQRGTTGRAHLACSGDILLPMCSL